MVAGCVCVCWVGGWGVGLFLTCSVLVTQSEQTQNKSRTTICWFCYGGFNSVLFQCSGSVLDLTLVPSLWFWRFVCFLREVSPLQSIIMNGDAEALMELVQRRLSSLMEPNDKGWIALHEAAYYGQLQCIRILVRGQDTYCFLLLIKPLTTPLTWFSR